MKKLAILSLIILILIASFSVVTEAGFKIWPGKLTITMNEWYDKWVETKYNKIQIINPYSYGINVSVELNHPGEEVISNGYSTIPDLSWIKIQPEKLYFPPHSSNKFEVIIEVPKDEQSKYFNEKWETWVVFNSDLYPGGKTGMNLKVELAVKLFINTPKGEASIPVYLPIVFIVFFSLFVIFIILFFANRRKNYLIYNNKPNSSMFFYRKKR